MAITLTITDEKLQESFDKSLEALLSIGNYHNPVKQIIDNIFSSYSGDKEIRAQLETHIKEHIIKAMATPEFATALGTAMVAEIAKREVDKLKK
jgi:hypothetical protein